MEIPARLKIGGHWVDVELTSDLPDDTNGDWDDELLLIRIRKSLPPSRQASTLIHEILHALNGTMATDTAGHVWLDSLAEQMFQVLSDNEMLR